MIPIYAPYLNGNEKKYVNECLDSTWISSKGKFIDKFENSIANYLSVKYASSCCNGTVALDLAFKALEIKEGDEIITTAFTYVASTNAILINKAKPVFVDIEMLSWNIDITKIEENINHRTKAILVSNVYGYLPNFHKLREICDKYNLFLIEDAAESLGSEIDGVMSGSFGDISTLSFFGNKTITTGEGGMVITSNKNLHDRVVKLKNQGNSLSKKYYHDILGYNYRMTNIQAAIGLAQLEQIENILNKKKNIFETYKTELDGVCVFQKPSVSNLKSSNWIVSILFDSQNKCDIVKKKLNNKNVETRPLFPPVYEFDFYSKVGVLQNTHSIFKRGLCLPSYPALDEDQLKYISNIIKS